MYDLRQLGPSSTRWTRQPAHACGPSTPRWRQGARPESLLRCRQSWRRHLEGRSYVGKPRRLADSLDAADRASAVGGSTRSPSQSKPYTITGAPQVSRAGRHRQRRCRHGVRGYVTAYDAESGAAALALLHRREIPSKRPEASPEISSGRPRPGSRRPLDQSAAAARPGTRCVYDPELNMLYIGTGNGSPWTRRDARARRAATTCFLPRSSRSIPTPATRLALPDHAGRELGLHRDAEDGARRPHDRRRDAAGPDAGAEEWLLLRARPRNGRTHVSRQVRRRELGESRRPEDGSTGTDRRRRLPGRRRSWCSPRPIGAHSWQAMAFNPGTGLVYIPAIESAWIYVNLVHARRPPLDPGTLVARDLRAGRGLPAGHV